MLEYPFDGGYILQNKRALKKQLSAREGLLDKRVALLSGTTVGEIKNILELFLLDWGIRPQFKVGDYARYYEELCFDDGSLRAFSPEVIYIHTGLHNLALPEPGCSAAEAEALFDSESARFGRLLEAARGFGCPVIINNFEYPRLRVMGNREAYDPSGSLAFIGRMNGFLAGLAANTPGIYINDINYLSSWYGLERWSDPTYYNAYKYAQAPEAIPLLCHSLASIIKSLFGKNKKALMLDLDNTLWGGVIGDEGVEGIRLGTESPEGIAYLDMQRYAKALTRVGTVLGVISKNEESAARSGFTHPSAVLKAEDFALFTANWQDKAGNLLAAAKALNLGSDALVFADDNPAEREIARQAAPGVAVPELGAPERFAETISMGGWFEVTTLSDDDRRRAGMYRENALREQASASATDYGEYLRSLEMRAYIGPFTPERLERVTQLANKTNQFNLTTRRYTADEMSARASDSRYVTLCGRLEDRFGDNGIVTEIVAEQIEDRLDIELWLMSCRVFRRELEYLMFDCLVAEAKRRGLSKITGSYLKTVKNVIVADFYPSLGFSEIGREGEDARFEYSIPASYENKNKYIEVHNG